MDHHYKNITDEDTGVDWETVLEHGTLYLTRAQELYAHLTLSN